MDNAFFWMDLYFRANERVLLQTANKVKNFLDSCDGTDSIKLRARLDNVCEISFDYNLGSQKGSVKAPINLRLSLENKLGVQSISACFTIPEEYVQNYALKASNPDGNIARVNLRKYLALGERFFKEFDCFYGWADEENNSYDASSDKIQNDAGNPVNNLFLFLSKPMLNKISSDYMNKFEAKPLPKDGLLIYSRRWEQDLKQEFF